MKDWLGTQLMLLSTWCTRICGSVFVLYRFTIYKYKVLYFMFIHTGSYNKIVTLDFFALENTC